MKIKNIFLMSLPALLLTMTACSNDEADNSAAQLQREIRLSSRIGEAPLSRAAGVNEYFIYGGTTVWMWADEVSGETGDVIADSEYAIDAWKLTANRAGGLEPGPEKTHVFPEANGLNFYGFAGNFADEAVTEDATKFAELGTLTHTIKADQTSEENIAKSDLLFGQELGLAIGTYDAIVPFYHLLSQIQVALIAKADNTGANQAEQLKDATITLAALPTEVSFKPAKLADLSVAADRAAMITGTANPQSIQIPVVTSPYGETYKYASAVIAPTTITSASPFITVTFKGETYEFAFDQTFESGKSYRLHLILEANGKFTMQPITVTSWDADKEERDIDLSEK